jgi:hypothetical protein
MSILKQNFVVRRLFRGKCREADDPQKFQKHKMITVVNWTKTENMTKMEKTVYSGAEGEM